MVLPETEKALIKKKFEVLVNDVELIVFTQELECNFCKEARELVLELGSLSPRIRTKIYDFVKNGDEDLKYNIKKIPAIAIVGKSDHGIRFYGVPSGYEINVLIEDILDVSRETTSLPENIKRLLSEIKKPVHFQVFVSPTCPYCPKAAKIAHQFAIENEKIRSDVIEMLEFPQLVQRYGVMSVPHIVINEDTSFAGAQPAEIFVEQIHLALSRGFNPMYS
ncbi:MAG: thioredoxin family protein [Candidatus Methanoperedens sp.]|nr:thioredoxin family protein [Candidatus Methanoperedens sp.]MCE8429322.1 thioredoxin family protein [Candidatus Methanoperedens sp.]